MVGVNGLEPLRREAMDFEYGQWPGNNPWNAGGQPLEGKNGRFIISIKVILSIIFGTKLGLSLFFILFNIIGYYGSYKLCKKFVKTNKLGHIFATLVISNSAVMFHLSAGHFAFFTYYLLPIIFYYFLSFHKNKWSGLKAGILAGIAFNENPTYLLQFLFLIMLVIGSFHFLKSKRNTRKKFFFGV